MSTFEFRAHVRLRFKLATGIGEAWTGNGGIPQDCPLSMVFTVALYLPWCRCLAAIGGVKPQLYDDNLKRVSAMRMLYLMLPVSRISTLLLLGKLLLPLGTCAAIRCTMKKLGDFRGG